jgi:hypothetical protein
MVSSARILLTWARRSLGEELADLETGLQANRICAGEQKVQREGLRARNTCFGLQMVQRARFRRRHEKLGYNGNFPHRPNRSQ